MPSLDTDRPSISDEERTLRARAIAEARASVRLEGTILSVEIEDLNCQYIDGVLSTFEHVEKIIETADAMAQKSASRRRLSAAS